MKKNLLLLFACLLVALGAGAQVSVCGVFPDENGHFDCPYIKSGTVTWNETYHTLTLDKAVIEYSSNNSQDGIRPIRVTSDATIVVHGNCILNTTGYVAIAIDSYNSKNVTITGDGTLSTSSSWIDIFLVVAHLTIQDITLNTVNGIANNAEGNGNALTFKNVQATIKGGISRIGEGITFEGCAITYPEDAYLEQTGYGYSIYYGNHQSPDKIIISRTGSGIKGDVNNDGVVNIADVNAVINIILGGSGNTAAADVNGDHQVNIIDLNAIINIILGGGASQDNHEYVDLGLPSGTLWATCNIGANNPEDYGDYFAWGETATKDVYNWETYKWCNNGEPRQTTKYCSDSAYGYNGFTDGKTELDPQDDAAYVKWGPKWRTPSKAQQDELREQCTWTWVTQNGVDGRLVTGPNGNTLFLPATGFRSEASHDQGSYGNYWSRTTDFAYFAYYLYFTSPNVAFDRYYRSLGRTIRAVRASQN